MSKRKNRKSQSEKALKVQSQSNAGGAMLPLVIASLIVAACAFVSFVPSLDAEFVNFDDDRLLLRNSSYQGLSNAHLRWMFTTTYMGHYQPLTWLSFAVDYQRHALNPAGYHQSNVVLHAMCAALFFLMTFFLLRHYYNARQKTISHGAMVMAAGFGALVFAVHPLRAESVAWVSERRDVLSTFFLLLAALAYIRSIHRGLGWYLLSFALLSLSLLCKAWGISFFVALVIIDFVVCRRQAADEQDGRGNVVRRIALAKLPFALAGVVAAIGAGYAQRTALGTTKSLEEWGIADRIAQAAYGLWYYPIKTVLPIRLVPLRELPVDMNPWSPIYLCAMGGVAIVVVLLFKFRTRLLGVVSAVVFYAFAVAPVLGFFQSGPQFVADRYAHISCMGFAILAAFAAYRMYATHLKLTLPISIAVSVALMTLTWHQSGVWKNSDSLWRHTIQVGPPCAIAHLNLGVLERKAGRTSEAIINYEQAVAIQPDLGTAWYALANAYKSQKRFDVAESAYRQAVDNMTESHKAWINLGNMYFQDLNRIEDAANAYIRATQRIEEHRNKLFTPNPYLGAGIALRRLGRPEEARPYLEVATKSPSTRIRAEAELSKLP